MSAPSDGYDDASIIAMLRRDPDAGLELLLLAHGGVVKSLLERDFGRFGGSLVDDALNRALEYVWKKPEQFDPARGSLRNWFGTIAYLGAQRLLRARPFGTTTRNDLDRHPSPPAGALRPAMTRAARALAEAIDRLSRLQRNIMLADLASNAGPANAAELAHQLETTERTIWNARHRAIRQLRKHLGSDPRGLTP